MPVPARLELPFRVRFDECTANGTLRSSAHLRYAQEAAWVHSETAGLDRAWYRERGLTWLVRCLELEIVGPVDPGQTLRVSTEVLGFRRVWARRRSEFRTQHDERIRAIALIDWVLVGATGSPVRVPSEILSVFDDPPGDFTPARVPLPDAPAQASEHSFAVRPHDLDPMGHVNNAAYLDFVEETVTLAGGGDDTQAVPRRYRLEYLAPVAASARLSAVAWRDEENWAYRLRAEDGSELLRGRLEADPVDWVGG